MKVKVIWTRGRIEQIKDQIFKDKVIEVEFHERWKIILQTVKILLKLSNGQI